VTRHADRWLVDVAGGAPAPRSVAADRVVLATGAYAVPREHRRIDGPRPSGIVTADLVTDALDRGWRPGRRAVVVGSGRLARSIAERLERSGVEIVARPASGDGVMAVRGERRLDGVLAGDAWLAADTLVLADAVRPAAFLLRGLGIGDDRPGVMMPAGPDGALPLDGMVAAGTCVEPRVDHDRSLAAGRGVGRSLAASLLGASSAAGGGPR
jgi:hypothetical protein